MKVDDIQDSHVLDNGAEIQRTAFACEVCVAEDQEPEQTAFLVEFEGQQVQVCNAHMQKLLDAADDAKEGGIWSEVFRISEP